MMSMERAGPATVFPLLTLAVMSAGCQPDAGEAAARQDGSAVATVADQRASDGRPADQVPRFTAEEELIRPEGWEAWVMVGASIGLSYAEDAPAPVPGAGPGMFHNIFMQPWAYEHFQETGEFAEATMFILAMYPASQEADPAQQGFYEGDLAAMYEVHLKKDDLHESGWGFYAFGPDDESAQILPAGAACYTCHAEKTDRDQVFVQFYPPLRRVAAPGAGGN